MVPYCENCSRTYEEAEVGNPNTVTQHSPALSPLPSDSLSVCGCVRVCGGYIMCVCGHLDVNECGYANMSITCMHVHSCL